MKRLSTFALALMLAFSANVVAQYRWVDKNGRVQYGDTPPPGAAAKPLRPQPGAAAPPAGAKGELTAAEREAEFRRRQLEAAQAREKQEQLAQEAAAKKDSCDRARENLRTLESGQRIARTDAKGERYFLDESQIAQETARARRTAQESC
jgi:hypothetical protein